MDIVLSKSNWFLIKYVCLLLGWLINGIYVVLDKIGIPNIGLAIILFTLIIYLALTPIQIKQQKMSKMMAVMQPEINKISKKYANNKSQEAQMKQQEETMAVYEKYGVSPTGSCLPTLIQMPILFGLYQVIYHIPGYIPSVRNIFKPAVDAMMGISGYSDTLTQFVSDNSIRLYSKLAETVTDSNIYDILYVLKPSQWTALTQLSTFSGLADTINQVAKESEKINYFLGFNITMSPMDIIKESMASGKYVAVVGAALIPILAWLTQWLNYKLMPQQTTNNNNDSMNATMKSMNTMMPLMSAFFCLSLSVGIGIYWIAGAVIRAVQQVVINRHMNTINLDEMIAKNQEKAAKKREKEGYVPNKITQQATQNVKQLDSQKQRKSIAQHAAVNTEGKDVTAKQVKYKSGSLADKASMVSQYNEAHSKKK